MYVSSGSFTCRETPKGGFPSNCIGGMGEEEEAFLMSCMCVRLEKEEEDTLDRRSHLLEKEEEVTLDMPCSLTSV